jgi:hypothetical protein
LAAVATETIDRRARRSQQLVQAGPRLGQQPAHRPALLGLHGVDQPQPAHGLGRPPLVNVSVVVQDSKAADSAGQRVRVGHFGEDAENLAQQLVRGTDVYVEGRLKMNTWTGADGTPRSGLNVTAWRLEALGQIGKRVPARPAILGSSDHPVAAQ